MALHKMKTVGFSLPPTMYEILRRNAYSEGKSFSAYISEILLNHLVNVKGHRRDVLLSMPAYRKKPKEITVTNFNNQFLQEGV